MINKGLTHIVHIPKKIKAKAALPQLTSHDCPTVRAIGEALHKTLNKQISAEEKKLIKLIEQRRSSLLHSDKQIAIIDYGAGTRSSNRTKEEMENGVHSTEAVADICRASKPAFWATFLFNLIRKLEPSTCFELGSCVGISASYQAAALKLNGKGTLVTLEGSPEIAKIANETLEKLKLQASVIVGPFHKTLKTVLESSKPIDFFFNDGHHDQNAVIQYFNDVLPHLSDKAVIVFDDISWSPGMRNAWNEIENDSRVAVSIDFQTIGIAFTSKETMVKKKFRIPL